MAGGSVVITILILYCIAMLGLGVFLSKKVKTTDDFWLGGRTLGPWVSGISYVATYYSSVAMIGSVATIYKNGLGYGTWLAAGCSWLFSIIAFVLVAMPIRRMSTRLGSITIPEMYGQRYGSRAVKTTAATITAIFVIPLVASILKAIGNTLEVIIGLPYVLGVLITSVVVLAYLWASGYYGVCVTDAWQGWMMLAGVCILTPTALSKVGGMSGMVANLKSIDPNLVAIPGSFDWGMFISLALVWGLTCWGQPHLLTRFMGIRSEKDIGRMCLISTVFATLIIGLNYANGPIARALYGNEFMNNPDIVIPTLIMRQLPPVVAGLYIAAIAAAMSSLDSVALQAASAIGKDIYEDVTVAKGNAVKESTRLTISRVVSMVVILAGLLMAIKPPDIIFMISLYSAGVLGASLGPTLFYTLFWRRANKEGCIASMLAGVIVTLIGYRIGLTVVHPYVPGAVAAILVFPLVSLLTPPTEESVLERAFGS